MEAIQTPESVAVGGREIFSTDPGDGFGVDGKREYQWVRESRPQRGSVEARTFFVRGPSLVIDDCTTTAAWGHY